MNRMFLVCLLLGLLGSLSVTSGLLVMIGRTANVPCNRRCSAVEWYLKKIQVYNFTEGNLRVAPEFEGRIKFSEVNVREGNISLTVTSVEYNDRGWYVCSCDEQKDCDHCLDVLVPTQFTAAIGDKTMVSCYAETDKLTSESNVNVRWEKDDKLVVKLEHGEMEFGPGFEERFSVSREDYKKGNLSLTIDDVKSSDAGIYKCSALNGKNKTPEIVTLTVTGRDSVSVVIVYIFIFLAGATGGVLLANWRKLAALLCCRRYQHQPVPGAEEK
ncbi:vascular endothelial growth factor receptor 3 isoform X1 [Tachysurus ichikawai]